LRQRGRLCNLQAINLRKLVMPDTRNHRGPDTLDRQRFGTDAVPLLRLAASDLSWLLTRGYASPSSLKLIGDRYRLDARQRQAVARCTAATANAEHRIAHRVPDLALAGESIWIDGFNVLTSVEAALAGGVILVGQDSTYRDMASMHGTYRHVAETEQAVQLIGDHLAQWHIAQAHWLLDAPVSNSGRLKARLLDQARSNHWSWDVELVADPDRLLRDCAHIVASADSGVLDVAPRWTNLARDVISARVPNAWVVDFVSGSCFRG
jgi:hypothetical protein